MNMKEVRSVGAAGRSLRAETDFDVGAALPALPLWQFYQLHVSGSLSWVAAVDLPLLEGGQ